MFSSSKIEFQSLANIILKNASIISKFGNMVQMYRVVLILRNVNFKFKKYMLIINCNIDCNIKIVI
jgi:hypothetical protein